jgi:hypothetical protein
MKLGREILYEPPKDSGIRIVDADLGKRGSLVVVQRHPDGKREAIFPKTGRTLALPETADYARVLPANRLLVVSIRANEENGRIFGPRGDLEHLFDLDAPVCDAQVDWSDGEFWVAYFRLGVAVGLAGEGLVRFNTSGNPVVKFASDFSGPESSGDLHPFCLGAGTTLWIFGDPDFALLEIDWNRWKIRSRKVPYECHGADALCARGGTVYMAGSRQHPQTVFAYDVKKQSAVEIGKVQGRSRVIQHRGGIFLDIQATEVARLSVAR